MKISEKNIGTVDRSVRLGLGIGLVVAGAYAMVAPLSYAAVIVGFILLFTGITSSCVLYSLLGINTAGKAAGAAPAAKKKRK